MAQAVRKAFAAGADTYDRARRKLVPCFDDFYRTVLELLPFKSDDRFEALDLGAGTGLLSAMIAEAFPKARLTLFDLTPEMLLIARQRLKPLGKRVRFVTADFAAAAPSKSYDAVVSALAIHHLPDSGKRHLFADIFRYLTSGGVLINADQVAGETAAIDQSGKLSMGRLVEPQAARPRYRSSRLAPGQPQVRGPIGPSRKPVNPFDPNAFTDELFLE
jgi:tRNA (cmo5U34)-methyltransferase